MMNLNPVFWLVLSLFVATGVARGDILNVPGDFETIQAAIDAAQDGDEIIVAPGTYHELINLLGKAIYLHSSDGREVTTIDGDEAGTVVTSASGEGPNTILEGFTITDGDNTDGGGMLIIGSPSVRDCAFIANVSIWGGGVHSTGDPTFTNCDLSDNRANQSGGGIYVSGSPTFEACTITKNVVPNSDGVSYGGGIRFVGEGSPTLINCVIDENSVSNLEFIPSSGAGVYGSPDSAMYIGCVISNNCIYGGLSRNNRDGAGVWGGGVFIECQFNSNPGWNFGGGIYAVDATLIDCTFLGNGASEGGGLYAVGSTNVINCSFIANIAAVPEGNAIHAEADATITNCLIMGTNVNGIKVEGGAVITNCTIIANDSDGIEVEGDAVITNCTIVANDWAGIRDNHGLAIITNCIIWANTHQIFGEDPASVTSSCIEDGWPGAGNIDADPLFVDEDAGDYHLSAGSPCIDAGRNAAVACLLSDLDGNERLFDDPNTRDTGQGRAPIVDMGVYEFGSPPAVVGEDCNGNGLDDVCETAEGFSADRNNNGIPDECELLGDLNGDGVVDGADLIVLLGAWGACDDCNDCPADLDGDCTVGAADLITLLGNWG